MSFRQVVPAHDFADHLHIEQKAHRELRCRFQRFDDLASDGKIDARNEERGAVTQVLFASDVDSLLSIARGGIYLLYACLTSITALLILLVMMLPVLACAATPKMSRMEQDSCHQMHGKCGRSGMHSCCDAELRHDLSQLPKHVRNRRVHSLSGTALLSPAPVQTPPTVGHLWHMPDEHSPPGLLITSITVLRI